MSGLSQRESYRAMTDAHGCGPDGATCSQCSGLMALPRIDRPQGFLFSCSRWDLTEKPRFHRSSWPACGLFKKSRSGRAIPASNQLITITCPGCETERVLNRNYVESHSRFDPRCGTCSKQDRTDKPSPIFNGCRPMEAGDGKRCLHSYECPNYESCLDYAAALIWPGFRGSKDPVQARIAIPIKPKRPYHRRATA